MSKGNLSITGSSNATGGNYDKVRIVGDGTIDGDLECNQLKCVGTMHMDGRLQASRVHVVGTGSWSNDVQADAMKISGTALIEGNVRLKELQCAGAVDARGNVYSERLHLKGHLNVQGDCESEVFVGRGIFQIGGLLNAGDLDIKLHRNCRAKEIGGGKIRIRKATLLNSFSFFFMPASNATLSAGVIEGDEIYLENTKAEIVRGNRVTIGTGCDIERVEYKEHFEQRRDSTVKAKQMV